MKLLLIRFLAWAGLKEAINAYVLSHNKKTFKDKLAYAFTDSRGRNYYNFPNLRDDMPLPLLEKLNELQEQMASKIPGRDLDRWIATVKGVLNDPKNKNKVTDAGYWIGVLEERRTITFDHTILMEIAALLYIREDENPCNYNAELHKEKFQMLWDDSKQGGGLYDFFQQAGLGSYIPSGSITRESWPKSLEETTMKIQKFNTLLSQSLTYVSESGAFGKNSETT